MTQRRKIRIVIAVETAPDVKPGTARNIIRKFLKGEPITDPEAATLNEKMRVGAVTVEGPAQ